MRTNRTIDHRGVEPATVVLAGAVYALWFVTLWLDRYLPAAGSILLIGVAIGWHGSLQHEVLHGHPFRDQRLNNALGYPPLLLRLPYLLYRRDHLRHHDDETLTDPMADTESFYVTSARWEAMSVPMRCFAVAHHTLLGRLVLGPPVVVARFFAAQWREIRRGTTGIRRCWMCHLVAVAAVLAVVMVVFDVRWWVYLLAVYVAHSITLVRSYLEHRWVGGDATRSATVASRGPLALLFLNNNLHDAHHRRPDLPWYRLGKASREMHSYERSAAGAGAYASYAAVARRFLIRPFDHPVHPLERT